jgi:transposase
VGHHSEAFIRIDTSKLRNAVAIAEGGRKGEVRYLGEIDATEAATQKFVAKLAAKYDDLTFCYEAGPTGVRSLPTDPKPRPRLLRGSSVGNP